METIMERLWSALNAISHDFDYPPDSESLVVLEDALTQAGLKIIEINDAAGYTAGVLSQMG